MANEARDRRPNRARLIDSGCPNSGPAAGGATGSARGSSTRRSVTATPTCRGDVTIRGSPRASASTATGYPLSASLDSGFASANSPKMVNTSAPFSSTGSSSSRSGRLQASRAIDGMRCCCRTPGPEVYGDGARPSVPAHGNKGSRNIAPFGQFGPAVLLQRRGRATSDFRCPRELDVLLVYAGSRETPGRVHDLVLPSRKTTVVVHLLSLSARSFGP